MRIVFDTGAIIASSIVLESADFHTLFASQHGLHIEILIPQVAVDELVNKAQMRMVAAHARMMSELEKINGLLDFPVDSPFSHSFPHAEEMRFRSRIEMLLRRQNVRILPYPEISHRDAALRAMRRRKPFKESGAGYRDYLLWRSVLEELEHTKDATPLCFVSSNTEDFFERMGRNGWRLHRDLQWDLDLYNQEPNQIQVFDSLRALLEQVITPRLDSLIELGVRIHAGTFLYEQFEKNSKAAIERWFIKNMSSSEWSQWGLLPAFRVESVEVNNLHWVEEAAVSVHELPNGELAITRLVECQANFRLKTEEFSEALWEVGASFSDTVSGGTVSETHRFVISAIIGPEPDRRVVALDAILVRPPEQKVVPQVQRGQS